jgi:hypothetical protein
VLWVAELDSAGAPRVTGVLTPTAAATAYTPVTTGPFQLRVTAEWTYRNYVTGLFQLSVQP